MIKCSSLCNMISHNVVGEKTSIQDGTFVVSVAGSED